MIGETENLSPYKNIASLPFILLILAKYSVNPVSLKSRFLLSIGQLIKPEIILFFDNLLAKFTLFLI